MIWPTDSVLFHVYVIEEQEVLYLRLKITYLFCRKGEATKQTSGKSKDIIFMNI
jgi:hypothetical protein